MFKFFKKLILCLILSKFERMVIWKSLVNTNNFYRNKGDVDRAADVQMVMNKVKKFLIPSKYTENEVNEIVNSVINEASIINKEIIKDVSKKEYERGYNNGLNDNNEPSFKLGIGIIGIKKELCDKCEKKDDCAVFKYFVGNDDSSEDSDIHENNVTEDVNKEKERESEKVE